VASGIKEKYFFATSSIARVPQPMDLVNGVVLSIEKNILPDTPEAKVSMVVLAPSGNS
jgi:hypothetical protein